MEIIFVHYENSMQTTINWEYKSLASKASAL